MAIVVTGANGFIGSNLAATLASTLPAQGERAMVIVDDFPSLQGHGEAHDPPAQWRYPFHHPEVSLSFLHYEDLPTFLTVSEKAGSSTQVNAILHMGACSDTTVTDREYVMRVNTHYTQTLWNWCAAQGKPLVYASSAATYGDGTLGFDDEADPSRYTPLNLYGQSKHDFDLWALEQSDAPPRWAGLKFFNVYGPNEQHKARMASMGWHWQGQIERTDEARLFKSYREGVADGDQQRDFIYVADAVDATLHLLNTPPSDAAPNGLYNIGTGEARTFTDLARAVFAAMDRPPKLVHIDMPEDLRAQYQYFTQATVSKLRRAGFTQPMHTVEQGMRAYVDAVRGQAQGRTTAEANRT